MVHVIKNACRIYPVIEAEAHVLLEEINDEVYRSNIIDYRSTKGSNLSDNVNIVKQVEYFFLYLKVCL